MDRMYPTMRALTVILGRRYRRKGSVSFVPSFPRARLALLGASTLQGIFGSTLENVHSNATAHAASRALTILDNMRKPCMSMKIFQAIRSLQLELAFKDKF